MTRLDDLRRLREAKYAEQRPGSEPVTLPKAKPVKPVTLQPHPDCPVCAAPGNRRGAGMAMKKLFLISIAALFLASQPARADDGDAPPKPPPFQPWQEVWQCNDVRVTITSRSPEEIEYDLGGMIWGGSRFTVVRGNLFFNGRPCVPLRPVGHWSGRARPSRR